MGASASKKDDATSKQGAPTRGPITFDQDTLRFVDGGPPPPPSETSTRLQSRCHDMFRRRTEKARTKQAPRAMSTLEALGAAKISLGEDAVAAAFGAEEDYLASIRNEPTITGTAPRLPWLGPRTFAARSPHAQAIQALDAQRTGAAILPAPGGAAGAGGDATRPWEGLPLVASSSARRDESLNHWEEWLRSGEKPYEVLWDDGNWPADEEPEEWNDFGAPYGPPPPFMNLNKVNRYYRGPLPDGVSIDRMSKKACGTDPTMLAHWARAEYYSRVRARYDAELAAYRAMRAKWRAQSGGRSRRAAAGPRSYNERDAYADLTRTETDRLIEENPKKFHERHMSAMKNQIACDESLLEAIAREAGVPRCVLTALDKNERPYLLSAVIKANLPVPGLGTELVLSNWDHIDKGWEDDPSVPIRKLGLRGLIWGLLNKKLPGYEWYLARSAERVYLEGYLKGALCFDNSFGEHFVLEIPLKDESAFRGMTTQNQQTNELHYIKNHLLKGAILGATKGRADAAWNSST